MTSRDCSQCSAVESVPGKVSGEWVLRGIRMPVETIFENLKAGATVDDIMSWYERLSRQRPNDVIDLAKRSMH